MSWTWTAGAAVNHVKVCMALFVPQSPDHNFKFGNNKLSVLCRKNIQYRQIFLLVSVQIKLQAIEETSGISWRITNTECKSDTSLQLSGNRVYLKDCELSLGQSYTLQCENERNTGWPNYNGWWKANFLAVENSIYCEYSDETKLINITITGKTYTLLINFTTMYT